MGMYDIINGEQVKTFGTPCWYGTREGVSLMGGSLTSYSTGNKIPFKDYWYNFTPNFIIVDTNAYEDDFIIFHVIEKGKVIGTFNYEEFDNKYFESTNKVLDYYGNNLNIKNKEEAKMMKEDKEIMQEEVNNAMSPLFKLLNESRDYHLEANKIKDSDPKRYNELVEKAKKLLKKHDQIQEKIHKQVQEIKKTRTGIYFNTEDFEPDCENLGMYIGAILHYSTMTTVEREAIDFMKNQILVMVNDKDLVDRYCKFQEMSINKFNKLIEKIKLL